MKRLLVTASVGLAVMTGGYLAFLSGAVGSETPVVHAATAHSALHASSLSAAHVSAAGAVSSQLRTAARVSARTGSLPARVQGSVASNHRYTGVSRVHSGLATYSRTSATRYGATFYRMTRYAGATGTGHNCPGMHQTTTSTTTGK